ncbi:MAG: hypothetical protein AAGB15_05815 [Pseudomonadota bacterium]
MGWSFENPSFEGVEGAYYSAMGSEMIWLILSIACCVIALIVGSMHEKAAYKREEEKAGR